MIWHDDPRSVDFVQRYPREVSLMSCPSSTRRPEESGNPVITAVPIVSPLTEKSSCLSARGNLLLEYKCQLACDLT